MVEKAAISPNVPTLFPLYKAPVACEQSSIILIPFDPEISNIGSMSMTCPPKCVNTAARVFGVIALSNSSGDILKLLGDESGIISFTS